MLYLGQTQIGLHGSKPRLELNGRAGIGLGGGSWIRSRLKGEAFYMRAISRPVARSSNCLFVDEREKWRA